MSIHVKHSFWLSAILSLLLITTISCAFPLSTPVPTATATQAPPAASNGNIGGLAGGGSKGGSQGGGNNGGSNGGSNNNQSASVPTTGPTPPAHGPYVVKQTQNQGGESISGFVCRLTDPFTVNFVTPKITFNVLYTPENASQGKWTYAYSFPSLGETHDASGSYTLSPAGADGTLSLAMTGADHVVFKGFDGKMPFQYSFGLAPATNVPCP